MSGRRPRILVRRPRSTSSFSLCSMGCGRLGRAASWLERERWHVGKAVSEGGVGGLLGVAERLDVGAVAPKLWQWLRASISCRVGDEVDLALFCLRFVFFSYVGASRVCSSHSSHCIFSSAWVGGRLVSASASFVVSSL